jgi:hypothetical protein
MKAPAGDTKLLFLVAVWGKSYVSLFTDICLPLGMTEGNLAHFRGREDVRFQVMTTRADAPDLEASPAWKRLQEIMPARILIIDDAIDFKAATYIAMSAAYRHGMRSDWVKLGHTNYVVLMPDHFWSDGTFRSLEQLVDLGYNAAMAGGLRTEREIMEPYLAAEIAKNPTNPVIANRMLVSKASTALHPMQKIAEWTSPRFSHTWPNQIYWQTGPDSFAFHFFHLHPIMVKSPEKWMEFEKAFDTDLVAKFRHPISTIYVETNSDVMTQIEMTPRDRDWKQPLGPARLKSLLRFGFFHATAHNWHFFKHRLTFLGLEPLSADAHVTFEMDRLVNAALRQSWAGQVRRFGSRRLVKYIWRFLDRLSFLWPKSVRSALDL